MTEDEDVYKRTLTTIARAENRDMKTYHSTDGTCRIEFSGNGEYAGQRFSSDAELKAFIQKAIINQLIKEA